MPRDWQTIFRSWAKPPSESEESRASDAAAALKAALRASTSLADVDFETYATGSYRNNTNVRLNSDVDIAVVFRGAFFYELPAGRRAEDFGLNSPASYGFESFRRDVESALKDAFGSAMAVGDKAFTVQASAGRMPVDATPFSVHRRYTGAKNKDGTWQYHEGVETRSVRDPTRRIINWHEEHYTNGVKKNEVTRRRYKRVVRVLKRLRDDMRDRGSPDAKAVASKTASFLLECLAYNAPNSDFNRDPDGYYKDVWAVLESIKSSTQYVDSAAGLLEVSGRKLLFGQDQSWTRQDANDFANRARVHLGT